MEIRIDGKTVFEHELQPGQHIKLEKGDVVITTYPEGIEETIEQKLKELTKTYIEGMGFDLVQKELILAHIEGRVIEEDSLLYINGKWEWGSFLEFFIENSVEVELEELGLLEVQKGYEENDFYTMVLDGVRFYIDEDYEVQIMK